VTDRVPDRIVDLFPEGISDPPSWLPAWAPDPREPKTQHWLRRVVVSVLVLSLFAFLIRGADRPADPSLRPDGAARVPLVGFGETQLAVRSVSGQLLEWCLLLAANERQWQRGLMQVTDPELGGYAGMVFRFPNDTTVPFYMRNTPQPLSIAYVDATGTIVSTADMAPCPDVDGCPDYLPGGPYRIAIEVPLGRLDDLGIVTGATITDEATSCA
jgi:uncharacterized membrane protein (UPF0127 family)